MHMGPVERLYLNMCQWQSNTTHMNKHVVMYAQQAGTLGNIGKTPAHSESCVTPFWWKDVEGQPLRCQAFASLCYSATLSPSHRSYRADSVKAAVAESSDQESHIPLSDILRDRRLNMALIKPHFQE